LEERASLEATVYSKLLIPLDGSALAEQTLPWALEVARRERAEVTLLCVVPPIRQSEVMDDGYVLYADQLTEMAQNEARDYLKRVACPLHGEGIKVKTALEVGTPADSILDYAQTMQMDLIAMTTHGRSGVSRWVYGSVADRVLRRAACPVLLMRAQPSAGHSGEVSRILVPLDGSPLAESVLPHAQALATAFNAEIVLLRVIGTPAGVYTLPEMLPILAADTYHGEHEASEYLTHWQSQLEEQGLHVRSLSAKAQIADAILDVSLAQQVSLIAMCTHGRSGVSRWFYGSVAERVLQAATVPILLVRACAELPAAPSGLAEEKLLAQLN
jgi:nucleotide-binding universal stress UspA family protein